MSIWTDEKIETARNLLMDGKTNSQIAKALGGGMTRAAVIGKMRRMGYANQAPRAGTSSRTSDTVRSRPPTPSSSTIIPLAPRIVHARHRTCQWPIGDPNRADFRFCGDVAEAPRPYCSKHAARAYVPPKERQQRV